MNGEQDERLATQGPRGHQGEPGKQGKQGEHGIPGLSRSFRQSLVFMFALAVILAAVGLVWIDHEVHVNSAAIQASYAREQVLQQRAGAILGEKLCTTFGALAALKPPAGNPETNPSRAFDDDLHARLDELGTDLGCR